MKKIVSVGVIILIVLGWFFVAKEIGGTFITYEKDLKLADESISNYLYEQGVEYYHKALEIKPNKYNIYLKIKDAYKAFYDEQQNDYSYSQYISALEDCCDKCGNKTAVWEELIKEYYESFAYSDAYNVAKKAQNKKIKSDYIIQIQKELRRLYETNYQSILSYKTGKNGTYSVFDGEVYWVEKTDGETVGIEYDFVGPLDENGKGLFVDNAGANIRDTHQITRVKVDKKITESGYFSSGLIPVFADGKWIYLGEDGMDSGIGSFDYAASMFDGQAAVKNGNEWKIIDKDGQDISKETFQEIALNQYGCHTGGVYYLAKSNDSYKVYSMTGEVIVDLKAEEVNIGNFNEAFAYKDKTSGLWGFVDSTGTVVIAPKYIQAQGFSNGYASVRNEDGLWGVIDMNAETVIENEFYMIGYFTMDNNCIVAKTEGASGILSFIYD